MRLHLLQVPIDAHQLPVQEVCFGLRQPQGHHPHEGDVVLGELFKVRDQQLRLDDPWQHAERSEARVLCINTSGLGEELDQKRGWRAQGVKEDVPAATYSMSRWLASFDVPYEELPGTIKPARPELTLMIVPTGSLGLG